MLFTYEIKDWTTWGNVFCSIAEFTPLVNEILMRENLAGDDDIIIKNLTPGTNAVFLTECGDRKYVVKVYVPVESGMDSTYDYNTELAVSLYMDELGIPSPKIIASGEVRDKYLFRYMIMDFIEGKSADEAFSEMNEKEKLNFISRLTDSLKLIQSQNNGNTKIPESITEIDLIERVLNGERIKSMSKNLSDSIAERVISLRPMIETSKKVLVHGDITKDNIILSSENKGDFYLIDFADAVIAPAFYELPPVIFDLLSFDKTLVNEFVKIMYDGDIRKFAHELVNGTAIHDFGAGILRWFMESENIESIESLSELEEIIIQKLSV